MGFPHIVPFAVSHNDTVSNGISLGPNLHRAFDRGLVSLNSELKVIVSNSFTENESNSSIKVMRAKRLYYQQIKNIIRPR